MYQSDEEEELIKQGSIIAIMMTPKRIDHTRIGYDSNNDESNIYSYNRKIRTQPITTTTNHSYNRMIRTQQQQLLVRSRRFVQEPTVNIRTIERFVRQQQHSNYYSYNQQDS